MPSIVPSLLAGDFARLEECLNSVEALGVSAIHIDVVDGHFRPQISVGQPVVRSISKRTSLRVDVHLLIERPERYIEDFVKAGADSLAFHLEATQNVSLVIDSARKLGTMLGLALDTATPVGACFEVLDDLDFVLLESGVGGKLQPSLRRVGALAKEREIRKSNFAIAAEGDVGAGEAKKLFAAGVDILVVSSAIFDKKEGGESLRALARTPIGHSTSFGRQVKSRVD